MKFQQYADKKKPVKEETINEISAGKAEKAYQKTMDKMNWHDHVAGVLRRGGFKDSEKREVDTSTKLRKKAVKFADYVDKKKFSEETKQLEFRPTSIPDKDQGPFTKNLKIIKKSDCAKEKLDEVSAELAQRASDKADQKASKLASKHMNWSKTSNKDKKYRRGIAKQETKAIKQHLKFSDYAAKKSMKEDAEADRQKRLAKWTKFNQDTNHNEKPKKKGKNAELVAGWKDDIKKVRAGMKEAKDDEPPFDNPTEKPSTPYKNSASKAKQLARAAMKKAMADKK